MNYQLSNILLHATGKRFIILYLLLFFIFRFIFSKITFYYIKDRLVTPHPIDVDAAKQRGLARMQYVIDAKQKGYDHARYYQSFLPLDLLFPIIYALLFLSALAFCGNPMLKSLLTTLVIANVILDWLEDISFSVFLAARQNTLAGVVAFFTSVKTLLFVINLLLTIFWIIKGLIELL